MKSVICVGGKRYAGFIPGFAFICRLDGCRFADAVSIGRKFVICRESRESLALFSFLSEMY